MTEPRTIGSWNQLRSLLLGKKEGSGSWLPHKRGRIGHNSTIPTLKKPY